MPTNDKATRKRFAEKMRKKEDQKYGRKVKKETKPVSTTPIKAEDHQLTLFPEGALRDTIKLNGRNDDHSFTITVPIGTDSVKVDKFVAYMMQNGGVANVKVLITGTQKTPETMLCLMRHDKVVDISKISAMAWSRGFAPTN